MVKGKAGRLLRVDLKRLGRDAAFELCPPGEEVAGRQGAAAA